MVHCCYSVVVEHPHLLTIPASVDSCWRFSHIYPISPVSIFIWILKLFSHKTFKIGDPMFSFHFATLYFCIMYAWQSTTCSHSVITEMKFADPGSTKSTLLNMVESWLVFSALFSFLLYSLVLLAWSFPLTPPVRLPSSVSEWICCS